MEWQNDGFLLSTDKSRLDLPYIHHFLSTESYWARGIPMDTVSRAVEGSLCFGIYAEGGQQAGFARVVTDSATFAYLADVFIDPSFRGQGLSKWMVGNIMQHPQLQGLRRFLLATRDAHGLYRQFGFEAVPNPENLMGIRRDYPLPAEPEA
ncbi:MAG TPA: GNAT family N-acetyltransferase [Chitinophagaceae bacterium]|jgi:GNAT superfamily N-acetyltransferase|nr:GNAT family N-acetyltransferase [Chitinophagaceae bacterium]